MADYLNLNIEIPSDNFGTSNNNIDIKLTRKNKRNVAVHGEIIYKTYTHVP